MKKLLIVGLLGILVSCNKKNEPAGGDKPCGDHHSQQLYKDSQGKCYLINSSGNKEYVEAHECDC